MRGRTFVAAVTVTLVAGACGSSGVRTGGDATGSPSATGTASPSLTALAQPGERCGFPDTKARVLWFDADDGIKLDGAIVGTGPSGVVLSHQYPASLCGWWPFASYLAS